MKTKKPRRTKRFGTGDSRRRILLVAPEHPPSFWSMQGTAEVLGARTLMPNAALATLLALTPDDAAVEYALFDENVEAADLDYPCDLVALTGGTLHARRVQELATAFRERGRTVALGGTYASIERENCRALADHLFIGEAEHTWPRFLHEWLAGEAAPVYEQEGYVDMHESPPPDWSLIEPTDYVNLNVQTSRGCPNQCEFCDVIQYVGRKYRTKTVDQIIAEVQNAHAAGARTLFFSDDNFLGNKRFTKRLLERLLDWNLSQARPLSFSTQITVQVADDEELLKLLADCRFSVLFLGVETVRAASLEEANKAQNLTRDVRERLRAISRHGILPYVGLIVGFDHDDAAVFGELEQLLTDTGCPIAGISLLNAPKNTPLYERLAAAGRVSEPDFGGEWQLASNVIPKQMSASELQRRYWRLFTDIYQPEAFEARMLDWLGQVEYFNVDYTNRKADLRNARFATRIFGHFLFHEPREVRRVFLRNLRTTWKINPRLMRRLFVLMTQYSHFHHFVSTAPRPAAADGN